MNIGLKVLLAATMVSASAIAQDGPVALEGRISSESFIFQPNYWPNPTVDLTDVSDVLIGRLDRFIPKDAQILGRFTDPLFTGDGRYRIDLPV
ncbi:hypothetical protein [Thetidibacter halocola]|uniref:ABC transporter substrate-binding protein n=1 Tax=Thetidibacter halocola TaxID=2827239 RepID=A0A8J7WGQ1_9RHOB|nr:hypothetical protein [Thetidibacter halocola]MBS0125006.1 hypothetical protein [Thetidibacter halocola]